MNSEKAKFPRPLTPRHDGLGKLVAWHPATIFSRRTGGVLLGIQRLRGDRVGKKTSSLISHVRLNISDEPPEVIMDALRRVGWSLGDARFGDTWTVSGTNGENVTLAHGPRSKKPGSARPLLVRNGPTFGRLSVSQPTPSTHFR